MAETSQLHRVHGREKLRLEHQLDVLQETLKRFQETLKRSEARESDLKKQLQEQQWQAVQAQAEDQTQAQACESEVEKEAERAVRAMELDVRSAKKRRLPPARWATMTWAERLACLQEREEVVEEPVQAQALVQQSQMPSTTDDEYLRRLSALQKLHTIYLARCQRELQEHHPGRQFESRASFSNWRWKRRTTEGRAPHCLRRRCHLHPLECRSLFVLGVNMLPTSPWRLSRGTPSTW